MFKISNSSTNVVENVVASFFLLTLAPIPSLIADATRLNRQLIKLLFDRQKGKGGLINW